jgi:hypothetical protein
VACPGALTAVSRAVAEVLGITRASVYELQQNGCVRGLHRYSDDETAPNIAAVGFVPGTRIVVGCRVELTGSRSAGPLIFFRICAPAGNSALPRPRNLHMNPNVGGGSPGQPAPMLRERSPMRFHRLRTIQALGFCTIALAALVLTACTDPIWPPGTTERLGHCIRNSERTDATVGTAGEQASVESAVRNTLAWVV